MRTLTIYTDSMKTSDAANDEHFHLSNHAHKRISERCITLQQVQMVLEYGRIIHSRRARSYVLGRKIAERLARKWVDMEGLTNIQVLVTEQTNTILTLYRNQNFRQIRPQHRRKGTCNNRHYHTTTQKQGLVSPLYLSTLRG